jgi:hypothetical protein
MQNGELAFDLSIDPRLNWAAGGSFKKTLHLGVGWMRVKSQNDEIHHMHDRKGTDLDHTFDLLEFPWPIADHTYDKVVAFHVLEHLPMHKVCRVMQEIRRVLRPMGVFILEVPEAGGMLKEVTAGNYGLMECIYGHDRYAGDQHRWAYYGPDIVVLLHTAGFDRTVLGPAKCYHRVQLPAFRAEATYYGNDNWTITEGREEEEAAVSG